MATALTISKQFLDAFAAKDGDRVAGLIGDNFNFRGPVMQFDDRASFVGAMAELAGQWDCRHDNLQAIEQDGNVALRYDFVMRKPVVQSLPMMEWHRIEDGKIAEIQLMFDTAKFSMPG